MFDTSEKTIQSGTLTTVNQKWADLLTDTGILCRLRGATVSHLPPPPPGTQSSTPPVPQHSCALGQGTSQAPESKKQLWKLMTSISSLTSPITAQGAQLNPTKGIYQDIRTLSKSLLSCKKESLWSQIKVP